MTRQSVLAAVSMAATSITPALGGPKTGTVESTDAERSFDPTRHGFGFYNWRVREGLSRQANEGLLEATRTNGYCYGMVFAAQ